MKYGHCPHCFRTYRSAASRALAENRAAILADLKHTASMSKHSPDPVIDKRHRHLAHSAEFRQTGSH